MQRRLERSTTDKVISGVCGGIAEYLQIDPTVVRVFFVIVTIVTAGLATVAYIVLLLLMPLPGRPAPFVGRSSTLASSIDAPPGETRTATPRPQDPEQHR